MRIKIDLHGRLFLERAGSMKIQICPYMTKGGYDTMDCWDGCPKFKDSVEDRESAYPVAMVDCCGTRWFCEAKDFTDEREVGK